MSGTSPAPRQRGNRHRKSGSVASAPQKNNHQHVQVHHQLAHNIPTPQMAVPNVSRGVTTPPHTPRPKDPAGKKRTRKPRPKDVNTQTTATYERNEQLPTPISSGGKYKDNSPFDKPLSTPKAYAGPTFHSSPAPSKLPVPSLFSKSVPSGIQDATLSKMMGSDESSSDSSTPSSSPPSSVLTIDCLFRRAKEEKTRKSSPLASSTPTKNVDLEQLLSGLKLQEPESPSMRFQRSANRARPAVSSQPFESALFNMDSDSDRASPAPQRPDHHRSHTAAAINPQFDSNWGRQSNSPYVNMATPVRARVNRAPPQQQLASPMSPAFPKHLVERPSPQSSPNRLLFNMDSYPSSPQHWAQPIERPAFSQPQSNSYPSPPNNNLQSMENDLRRMLGMDPAFIMAGTTVA
jgi:hypothetical protein